MLVPLEIEFPLVMSAITGWPLVLECPRSPGKVSQNVLEIWGNLSWKDFSKIWHLLRNCVKDHRKQTYLSFNGSKLKSA